MDAAIGFVVARGDQVDRARLSYLRTGAPAPEDAIARTEMGQAPEGGWPATWGGEVASIDATCFRLAELDDLGALGRPAAHKALDWLAGRQRPDGTWEEDASYAQDAPPWARPGDPEARLYLTALASYWLIIGGGQDSVRSGHFDPRHGGVYAGVARSAAQAIAGALRPDGSWPSFLIAGWLGAAVLYRQDMFYESARMQLVLADRLPKLSAGDTASLAATLRRAGVPDDDALPQAARARLAETQRTDGGWPSDDGDAFDVHTTLLALRAARP
ncbi:prenyltransferase/squalene oxidase repeat-containing protein [Catenuloplanes japonicus]|uniref:prenyltransferase/squalene oxidase repeat-containing protein n=1 Tax=Catenuloplanes japonicus TaxID=33876 RepID=UPI000527F22C|nr:prenyltransferase/squalene oxidase repeat-containing protein [Catenuloplanes japonicus]